MAQVKEQIEQPTTTSAKGSDQQGSEFPPLRERIDDSEDRWEIISQEMARHQDILAELADS